MEESLKALPFFSGLENKDLKAILYVGKELKIDKGEIVFSEGELCRGIYIVKKGELKLYKLSEEGKEYILHFVNDGEIFGGAPIFLEDGKYPAYAEAKKDSIVIFISKSGLLRILAENSNITFKVLHTFSKYLDLLVEKIGQLSLMDVSKRLAQFLLKLANENKTNIIELKLSQQDIASKLGTVREVISRALKQLQKKNLIKIQGKKISILFKEKPKEF